LRWHSRGIVYTQEITAACCKSGSFRRGLAFEKLPSLLQHELEKVTTPSEGKKIKLNTVPLNWKEVYYASCPLVSASNVDQELGWTKAK
jgi:hypothetical protein